MAGSRLRQAYFVLAAFWGFIVGAGAIMAVEFIRGRRIPMGLPQFGICMAAFLLALFGGFVIAGAYRDSRRRRRY